MLSRSKPKPVDFNLIRSLLKQKELSQTSESDLIDTIVASSQKALLSRIKLLTQLFQKTSSNNAFATILSDRKQERLLESKENTPKIKKDLSEQAFVLVFEKAALIELNVYFNNLESRIERSRITSFV